MDKQQNPQPEELTKEQAELLEKYDAESRFRTFKSKSIAIIVSLLAISLSVYHMYTSYFGTPVTLQHRSLHVAAILALVFLLYPPFKKSSRQTLPWYDFLFTLMAFSTTIYIFIDYVGIVNRGGLPNNLDLLFGGILVVLVLEAARRVTGWGLPVLAILFFLYGLFGRELSGIFRHRGYTWDELVNFMYVTTEGIYGTAIGVSATYIFLFILFGAFLSKSGMGQFFNDMALAIAGQTRGGPAKVAVIASGFLGSINGAAVANVVTTGSFTIPLMKKIGYHRNFAGAVEAAASVGGQILPPIMGAAAFIMAEMLGIPYSQIALAALLPALLFYLGIIVQIHLRATKEGLRGISKENLPQVMAVLKERGHLLIPLFFLLYMLFFSGRTIIYSAFLTILVTIVVAMLRKTTRMSIKDIVDALESGARTAVGVAVACATVGIVVGVATMTGFGLKLANGIVTLGGDSLLLTLIFTMIACIVLGMGLPSIPTYIITATMAAPALISYGIEPLVAHLFVFYFGLFANITPPVALAAFAAAGISGGDQMRTGFVSMKLAIAGFIVPFMFVYNDSLLLINTTFAEGAAVAVTAILGVVMLGTAAEGYLFRSIHWVLRIVLFAGAILFMNPNMVQDIIGLAIILVVVLWQWRKSKKTPETAPGLTA
ncbi:C4-dicarboxylate ABC transporter permease [Alkalihalophilus pseudofirmus]|uniref:TRAP transporter permease n=1 Tax=Alkalihalophilus pseudofirmus TaxID=79885 RepID=A0AAJ2NNQ7_ALKPS|nr:TRAP transporter permease [Alkalihalophilus pseudofirmus]MDV2885725.1 TRAP transporter permease [Alkalihalophilus pseudofirmus]OLS39568.1 C4-dicarboxylate ABC transporter permease [Alkalihalophilus pseudofirmus]WEG16027.1 TRAP transporter permease [Alkalihalophilus pseudofirmus]